MSRLIDKMSGWRWKELIKDATKAKTKINLQFNPIR